MKLAIKSHPLNFSQILKAFSTYFVMKLKVGPSGGLTPIWGLDSKPIAYFSVPDASALGECLPRCASTLWQAAATLSEKAHWGHLCSYQSERKEK